ncbi:MAG TPA: shikimate dehydrogenase [Actinomycetes bacterium]|nr:shikimate dehydrogenase [Actinomycetes bacterium]
MAQDGTPAGRLTGPVAQDGARRAAVLGSPIAHSLSPVLHRAGYAELGLDWRYDAFEVDAAALPGFLSGLDERWVGLSLTMPLKRAVLPLCARLSPVAAAVGAANTVLWSPDRSRIGENTDVPGLVAALESAGVSAAPERIAVLGGGATAASALAAVARLAGASAPPAPARPVPGKSGALGRPVEVFVRDPRRAPELDAAAARVGAVATIRRWPELRSGLGADLVISTVPVAGSAVIAAAVPERVHGLLFDVVYHPWPTPLAVAWVAAGGAAAGGLGLLVQQAALQIELMTGRAGVVARLVPVLTAAAERAPAG